MQKKTIIHFIYSLGRGGAEVMLVRVLKELTEYRNIVVEIYGENAFGSELECDKYISLNLKSTFMFPIGILKLKRILKKYNADLIHTHLFWPTVIARIATPKRIPLLTTIHTSIAHSLDYKLMRVRIIDKLTYRIRKNIIIGVSKGVLEDYFKVLNLKRYQSYLLYTFVDTDRFKTVPASQTNSSEKFLIVSVAALRQGKNFEYLIRSFAKLKNPNVEFHIYGAGCMRDKLQSMIDEYKVPIILQGERSNIQEVLPSYNMYISASCFEGFSLSILEAMALRLPLLLSDIPSFREQCNDTAMYFNLSDENDFVNKLNVCMNNPDKLNAFSCRALTRVLENFTLPYHTIALKKIYSNTLALVSS